jgi:hypothetical protein
MLLFRRRPPDEAFNLQHRDVAIVTHDATDNQILEIEVRGKRGVGHCKSMPGAVRVYRKSNPDIFVMQSAEDRAAKNTTCPHYGAR